MYKRLRHFDWYDTVRGVYQYLLTLTLYKIDQLKVEIEIQFCLFFDALKFEKFK